jgi:hypothetical protein
VNIPQTYVPPRLQSPLASNQSKPVVRAQSDGAPPAVRIPTPEELGLGKKLTEEALDWSTVERKLDSAGVSSYQMERTSTGFKFTCKLASRSIAGVGASKADAVRQVLDQIR